MNEEGEGVMTILRTAHMHHDARARMALVSVLNAGKSYFSRAPFSPLPFIKNADWIGRPAVASLSFERSSSGVGRVIEGPDILQITRWPLNRRVTQVSAV